MLFTVTGNVDSAHAVSLQPKASAGGWLKGLTGVEATINGVNVILCVDDSGSIHLGTSESFEYYDIERGGVLSEDALTVPLRNLFGDVRARPVEAVASAIALLKAANFTEGEPSLNDVTFPISTLTALIESGETTP